MIFVSSARPFEQDPTGEYVRNQLAAFESWKSLATAIVYFNAPQAQLKSPITRFLPAEQFPRVREMVDFCADQDDWCVLLNADIVMMPNFKPVAQKLKAKRAVAASSWRWNFDPAVGLEPSVQNDAGLDFFMAASGAWELVYQKMGATPQGDHDSAKCLRWGSPQWDSWMLATFFHLFSNLGFYNITSTRCVRHPIHGGRAYGHLDYQPHFWAWPVMGANFL